MNKELIIVRPGTLSAKDKEKLTKAGKLVIEHENPTSIIYRSNLVEQEYVFTNCHRCGERIYVLKERLTALIEAKNTFYCSHGHSQQYK
jgi:hypothetical protein